MTRQHQTVQGSPQNLAMNQDLCDVLSGFIQRDWQSGFLTMARPKGRQLPNRVSVALTEQQFMALESLAMESQAAVSWVIRRAVAEYLERHCPAVSTEALETGNDDGTGKHQL